MIYFTRLQHLKKVFVFIVGLICLKYLLQSIYSGLFVSIHKTLRKQQCIIPKVNAFDETVMSLYKNKIYTLKNCPLKYRGRIEYGYLYFQIAKDIEEAYFVYILRANDNNNVYSKRHYIYKKQEHQKDLLYKRKIVHDFIKITYKTLQGGEHVEYLAYPIDDSYKQQSSKRVKETNMGDLSGYNIIMVMVDSLSNANAERQLPMTYKYLQHHEQSVIMKGHTINGDGTTQQLLAMLTGKLEHQLYEGRRGFANSTYIDKWPFLFQDFAKANYRTLFSEDDPTLGTFNYRLKGFHKPPTLKYLRPWWNEVDKFYKTVDEECRIQHHLDYIKSFMKTFRNDKKFALVILSSLSHHYYDKIIKIDYYLHDFVTFLRDIDNADRNIVILFSDHGSRFGKLRNLEQGKLEELLPLMAFIFPKNFKQHYPHLWKNINTNSDVLTTHFDVYATLKQIISDPNVYQPHPFAKSFFSDIKDLNRSCEDAGISPHYCPCTSFERLNENDGQVMVIARFIVNHINNILSSNAIAKEKCQQISLLTIIRANKVASMNTSPSPNTHFFNLIFLVSPNKQRFESTVKVKILGNKLIKSVIQVSRLDQYGEQANCIAKEYPYIRSYCICDEN